MRVLSLIASSTEIIHLDKFDFGHKDIGLEKFD